MLLSSSHFASYQDPRFPFWYWVVLVVVITALLLKIAH
jgi:hypothetical protein